MSRLLCVAVAIILLGLQGLALEERRSIRVVAERFAFTPSKIEVDAGEEVELVVRSDDTSHGLRIAGTGVDIAIPKRGSGDARVSIKIEEPGRYTFECSRMCGAGHGFMRGELIVRARRDASTGR